MLRALFGGRGQQEEAVKHDVTAVDVSARSSPRKADQGGAVLLSLPLTVTLREVSGSLDRNLGHGTLRITAPPSTANGRGNGNGALGSLRVGATEVPLGLVSSSPRAGQAATTTAAPRCHRVDSRTLRLTLGSEDDTRDGGGASNFSSSSLLLVFPREATDHDVSRTMAILTDLATGRGQLDGDEPAGAAAYGLGPTTAGGAAAAAGLSDPNSLTLFHDLDPARSLGWKNDQPVRLTHLERIPPRQKPMHGGGGGSPAAVAEVGGRTLVGPLGAEVGSPGGTRLGKLKGLGLGTAWGSVAVANLAYEKDVRVRYSLDGWDSYDEVSANWDKRLGLGADNFNFSIDLDRAAAENGVALRTTLAAGNHVTLSLAVHFLVSGQDHWDNNEGANYTFDVPCE